MQSLKIVSYMNNHPVVFDGELPIAEAVERLLETRKLDVRLSIRLGLWSVLYRNETASRKC